MGSRILMIAAVVCVGSTWTAPAWAQVLEPTLTLEVKETLSLAFSSDGKTVASQGGDGSISLWDSKTGKKSATLGKTDRKISWSSLAFSPDGKTLASYEGARLEIWDIESRKSRSLVADVGSHEPRLAFSPDGKRLATGNLCENELKLWDIASGKAIVLDDPLAKQQGGGHSSSLVFLPDGKTLASIGSARNIKLWDLSTGKPTGSVKLDDERIFRGTFSRNAKVLAGEAKNDVVKLFDAGTGKILAAFRDAKGIDTPFALDPEGKLLAYGNDDGMLKVFDVSAGRFLAMLKGHQEGVVALSFSDNGEALASACSDTIRFWSLARPK